MLRGRRLPLPQPALPGWSSKPPSALTAARFFSSTDSHRRDPRDLFFNLRQQLRGETEAKKRARKEESAQRNQPTRRANDAAGEGVHTKPFEKPRKETAQSKVQHFEKELEGTLGAPVYSRPSPPKGDEIIAKTSLASHNKTTEGDRKPEKAGSFLARLFNFSRGDHKGEDTKIRTLRAWAQQTGTDTGTKSRIHATTDAAGKDTRQVQLETENKLPLPTPKDAADAFKDKTQVSPSAKSLDSNKTAANKALSSNFFQQVDLSTPLIKLSKAPSIPSDQKGSLEENNTSSPKKAETAPPRKEESHKAEDNSAKSIVELLLQEDITKRQQPASLGSKFPKSNASAWLTKKAEIAPPRTEERHEKEDDSAQSIVEMPIEMPIEEDVPEKQDITSPGSDTPKSTVNEGFIIRRVDMAPPRKESIEENSTRPPKQAAMPSPRKEERRMEEDNSGKSIFDMLFREDVTKRQNTTPWKSRSTRSDVDELPTPDVTEPSHPVGSIYDMLFPKEPEVPEVSELEAEGTEAKEPQETLTLPEDSIFVSLRNEVRNWIPPEEQHEISAPQPREYGSQSTVVTIWGVSPSLSETDFYRIIPESKHVEGWAGGLVKVVQARNAISQVPLGRYYLMFHSRPAAVIYADELRRLHALSQKLVHPSGTGLSRRRSRLEDAPVDPQSFMSEEEHAAVDSFTICSPDLPLKLRIEMLNTTTLRAIAANGAVEDVVRALESEADAPAKVLITVTLPGGGLPEPSKYGLTTTDLWLTIRDDGRERSAPWLLANLTEGIMPVKIRAEGATLKYKAEAVKAQLRLDDSRTHDHDDDEDMPGIPVANHSSYAPESNSSSTKNRNNGETDGAEEEPERFTRFILTFKHRQHAKRFVRCWHKRTIHDVDMERHVVVDAVALM